MFLLRKLNVWGGDDRAHNLRCITYIRPKYSTAPPPPPPGIFLVQPSLITNSSGEPPYPLYLPFLDPSYKWVVVFLFTQVICTIAIKGWLHSCMFTFVVHTLACKGLVIFLYVYHTMPILDIKGWPYSCMVTLVIKGWPYSCMFTIIYPP